MDSEVFVHTERKKALFYVKIGNFLEYYDFSLYAFLSTIMANIFFDAKDYYSTVMYGYSTFAVTFLARPIGGWFFGMLGDKKGRLVVLTTSILVTAISTFLLAILPSYARIGIIAAALLIILRCVQCFSLAGEYVAALIISAENAEQSKRGKSIGNIVSIGTLGWLAGSIVAQISIYYINRYQDYSDYIWRIPFFIGGLLSFFIYFKRKQLFYLRREKTNHGITRTKLNLKDTKYYVITILFAGWNGVLFYGLFIYPPIYKTIGALNAGEFSLTYTVACIACYAVCLAVLGCILDKLSRWGKIFFLLSSIPGIFVIYWMLNAASGYVLYLGASIAAFYCAFIMILTNSIIPDFYDAKSRFKSMSIFYNIGLAVFGGTAPVVCTYLQANLMNIFPFIYIALFSLFGTLCFFLTTKMVDVK